MPDIISFSTAISACEKGGQWQHTLPVQEEMCKGGMTPNVINFDEATSAGKKGEWRHGRSWLLGESHGGDETPKGISTSAAISACEKGGQWQQALPWLDELHMAGSAGSGSEHLLDSTPRPKLAWLLLLAGICRACVTPSVISFNASNFACELCSTLGRHLQGGRKLQCDQLQRGDLGL